jgi:uncharacterized RDD family membrane protein YckC
VAKTEIILLRTAPLAWVAALAAAAYSTWNVWRAEYGSSYTVLSCVQSFEQDNSGLTGLASALLGDAYEIANLAVVWGVPSALVLTGFLMSAVTGNGAIGGRRVAGTLVLLAIVGPATPGYVTVDSCSMIPLLSGEWFATVASAYGPTESALILSALLVLLASRTVSNAWPSELAGHRAVAFTFDYLVLVAFLDLFEGGSSSLDYGLLNWLHINAPASLLVAVPVFSYVLTGRTFGKRLMRIRVVSADTGHWPGWRRAAIRAFVFPVLICVPQYGLIPLLVVILWSVTDPAARPLHDRLAGTRVVRDRL